MHPRLNIYYFKDKSTKYYLMYFNNELHAYGLESMMLIPISRLVGIYDIKIARVDSTVDIDLTEALHCKQETKFRQYLEELGLKLKD